MYIRNLTKHDIPFNYGGKRYVFPGDSLTPIDENELPYRVLENLYGNHRLSKIEDKYIKLDRASVGSNFDDFLKEEGILEEVEEKAKEKVKEFISSTQEETIEELGEGICTGELIAVEGAIELPVEEIVEVKEETKSNKKKK